MPDLHQVCCHGTSNHAVHWACTSCGDAKETANAAAHLRSNPGRGPPLQRLHACSPTSTPSQRAHLLRRTPQDCIQQRFQPEKVFGGDTLFSHCVLFTGVAPTDPGHFLRDTGFNGFDPGGQLVRSVLDLFYAYLKKSCCDALCEARLRALTSLHLRGMHFKVGAGGGGRGHGRGGAPGGAVAGLCLGRTCRAC